MLIKIEVKQKFVRGSVIDVLYLVSASSALRPKIYKYAISLVLWTESLEGKRKEKVR